MKFVVSVILILTVGLTACGGAPGGSSSPASISVPDSQNGAVASPTPTPNPILVTDQNLSAGPCSNIGGNSPKCGGVTLHWVPNSPRNSDGYWTCALDSGQNLYCWNNVNNWAKVTAYTSLTQNTGDSIGHLALGTYPSSGSNNELSCVVLSTSSAEKCAEL